MLRRYNVDNPTNVTLTTTDEVEVCALEGVSMSRPGQAVRLHGQAHITTGAGATHLTLRVRRDGVAGALVGEAIPANIEAAAGSTEDHDIVVTDAPSAELAGARYALTAQQTAAGANGTCLHSSLEAVVE